ncbi:UNVERIFIED_CONTAM: hypothetical protein Sangu_2757000 [Sesamum angustifolium]|uniref:Uncharacterized protein n=1 Tax=Sesamum angustifolium TaxID=2727405 RepID=A0AAW2IVM8_9LAMI
MILRKRRKKRRRNHRNMTSGVSWRAMEELDLDLFEDDPGWVAAERFPLLSPEIEPPLEDLVFGGVVAARCSSIRILLNMMSFAKAKNPLKTLFQKTH